MAIVDDMRTDLTAALKDRDTTRSGVLRLAMTRIKESEVSGAASRQLDDGEVQAVLRKQAKECDEAGDAFAAEGRDEQAAHERRQAEILRAYLPAELDDAELRSIIESELAAGGFEGPRAMGPAMKAATAAVAGRADGKRVSTIVRDLLAQ